MYLALLEDNEKELFLGLAYNLAAVDGDYSDAERAIIAGYCQEMFMDFDENTMIKPIEMIIEELGGSTERAKKIVIFESIGLAMSDGNYDNLERNIVAQMCDAFGIDKTYVDNCEKMLNDYISFQNDLNALVVG